MGHLEKGADVAHGMSGAKIYLNFTSEAPGPARLDAAAQQALSVASQQFEELEEWRALAVKLESAWRGEAADAAKRGLTPFAIEHESSADALTLTSGMMSDQSAAFSTAQYSVVPVPPAPDKPSAMQLFTDSSAMTTFQQQAAEADVAGRHNVSVMQAYEAASTRNTDNMPAVYGRMAPDSASVVVEPVLSHGRDSHAPHLHAPMGQVVSGSVAPQAIGADQQAASTNFDDRQTTATESAQQPSGRSTGELRPLPRTSNSAESAHAAVDRTTMGHLEPGRATAGGVTTGRGSTGGVPQERLTGGQPASGRPSAGQAESIGNARSTRGLAESFAPRESSRGGMPMGAAAPGRGRDEDRDRERPGFLLEPEPEDLFGTDETTAPPVIE